MKKKKIIVLASLVLLTIIFHKRFMSFLYSGIHLCKYYDYEITLPDEIRDSTFLLSEDQSFIVQKKENNCSFYERNIVGTIWKEETNKTSFTKLKIKKAILTECFSSTLCFNTGSPGIRFLLEDNKQNQYMVYASTLTANPVNGEKKFYSFLESNNIKKPFDPQEFF